MFQYTCPHSNLALHETKKQYFLVEKLNCDTGQVLWADFSVVQLDDLTLIDLKVY